MIVANTMNLNSGRKNGIVKGNFFKRTWKNHNLMAVKTISLTVMNEELRGKLHKCSPFTKIRIKKF